ncbi:hypothetical protein PV08_06142 [Exophiala spinifera]|uniref:Zn(2)-C6 fungal-type domain-containing protein n=1 Tax=Exophiala spinifera TaxID=91928 RepID=A0A0D1YM61_9EURO|nr:uncharacterized protein PV08_06142 [Exophiala spinifera]KIW16091.1 hypothetical protein PV08_06142 [Exophiala spinifera]
MKTARPYRSHRYPACERCHKRRSRCVVEVPGQGCIRCYTQRIPCSLASSNGANTRNAAPRIGFVHRSRLADDQALESHAFLLGPVVARDKQILDQYLPRGHEPSPSDQSRQDPEENPIYHMPIPPRMPSPTGCQCERDAPRELLAQVEPYLEELMSIYFDHISPCYPIIDEEYIMTRVRNGRHQLPQLLLVVLISHALFHWDLSPGLESYKRPDQDLAWQSAVALNAASIQKGDVATIATVCIGVSGRPCQRLVNNATNVARCVALAHIVGLNHDCQKWKIRDLDKRTRCKVWWGLLVQDRWFNFAQGTPPYISQDQYDVPVPTVDLLVPRSRSESPKHVRAAEIYIQLCHLTEILGEVLPMIYRLRGGMSTATDRTARLEVQLDSWVEDLPTWLKIGDFSQSRSHIPGLVNLQLSYLAVRMLLCRIAWHEHSLRLKTSPDDGVTEYSRLLSCQAAAEDVVRLVMSLTRSDLSGFWLPYNAHHFTSAVTLLLRCALHQTVDQATRDRCMASARTLIDRLRRHSKEDKWDLAETCLSQSESILKRIDDLPTTTIFSKTTSTATTTVNYPPRPNNLGHEMNDPIYSTLPIHGVDDTFASQPPSFTLPGQADGFSLEELFPEIFGDWCTDNFLLDQDTFSFDP